MFKQIMKLNQARRAYREGRYDEALRLAEDPSIRDHVKVQKLRAECLAALQKRAAKRSDKGELTLAAADVEQAMRHEKNDERLAEMDRALEGKRRVKEEMAGRVRGLYYRARLDVERGELGAAIATLESVEPAERSDEMKALLADVRRRVEAASSHVADARAVMKKRPQDAEELLGRASRLHPRDPELMAAWRELAERHAADGLASRASLAELADGIVHHGILKRTRLTELDLGTIEALDAPWNDRALEVAKKGIGRGDEDEVRMLLDRQAENLTAHEGLAALRRGLRALELAHAAVDRGDDVGADDHLAAATEALGKTPGIKDVRRRAEHLAKKITPRCQKAEAHLRSGRVEDARRLLLDVLEEVPGHRGASQLLDVLNKKRADQEDRLAEARRLVGRGRIAEAKGMLLELKAESCDHGDISVLLEEVALRERKADEMVRGAERVLGDDAADEASRAAASRDLEAARALRADHSRAGDLGRSPSPIPLPPAVAASPRGGSTMPVEETWMLTVEEHGEHLVLEQDSIIVGNAVKSVADMPVLANIASRHAQITRTSSFHGGLSYKVGALEDRPVTVNDKKVTDAVELSDGDRIRLGRDFVMTFRMPSKRSKAAVLELAGEFDVVGAHRVLLMPEGRTGSILVADSDEAHVRTDGAEGDLEIYRDRGAGPLTVQGAHGVAIDGDEARGKGPAHDGSEMRAGELVCAIRTVKL